MVTAIQANGIEVKVNDVLTGFIRRAELARDKGDQRPDRFAVGEKVDAKIIAVDRAARKLTLTIKGKEVEEEKQAMAEFGSSDSGASLGDILGAAIRRRNQQAQDRELTADRSCGRHRAHEPGDRPVCWTGGASSAACLLADGCGARRAGRGAGGSARRRACRSSESAHLARLTVTGIITEDRKLTEAVAQARG